MGCVAGVLQCGARCRQEVLLLLEEALAEDGGHVLQLCLILFLEEADLPVEGVAGVLARCLLEGIEHPLLLGDVAEILLLLAIGVLLVRGAEELQHLLAHLQFFELHVELDDGEVVLVDLR